MNRLIVSSQKGFSLLEILIAITILGILAGLGIPNLLALMSRAKVREGFGVVQNALQDAQRQAVRLGGAAGCTIQLDKATGSTSPYYDRLRATPLGCITTQNYTSATIDSVPYQIVLLPEGVKVATNVIPISPATVPGFTFSYQGHIASYSSLTGTGEIPTLVAFAVDTNTDTPSNDSSQMKKCLMASSMLALFRTGSYGDVIGGQTSISSTKCNPPTNGS